MDPKQIHERFIANAMKLASKDQYEQMIGIAKSAGNPVQALGRALLFVLQAVKKGLEEKGVQIPGDMWLAQNGLIEQVTRVVAALLEKAGIQQSDETIAKAMELVAKQMANEQPQGEPGMAQQPATEQGPQAMPQEQPMQSQGLLSQGMQV